jgi:hypothetical protein
LLILKFYIFLIGTFTRSVPSFPYTFPIWYRDIHYYKTTICYFFSLNSPFWHII